LVVIDTSIYLLETYWFNGGEDSKKY
jgi:hypothetical protein